MSDREGDCSWCPSRRALLRAGGAGIAAAVLAPGCSGGGGPAGPIAAGNVADTGVGALSVLDAGVVLGRDDRGLYALSATCTHAGCQVILGHPGARDALICPCHASKFDNDGAVTSGPATIPLPHYEVDLAPDGSITIQAGTIVDPMARTMVP